MDHRRVHGIVTTVWAVAVLVHLLGNPATSYGDALPGAEGLVVLVVAVLAGAVALRPGDRRLGIALTVAVVWLGAMRLPVLANNLVLLGVVGAALHSSRVPRTALANVVRAGAAAYAFAAFAKLNTAFLDPAVSCAPVYLDQLVGSWGLPAVPRALADLTPVATILVESAVAIGLLVPRLRRAGAVLGVLFHGLLAYDLYQHFWDFSSALLPVFAAAAPALAAGVADRARRMVPATAARFGLAVLVGAGGLTAVALPVVVPVAMGHLVWAVLGTGVVLVMVLVAVVDRPPRPERAERAAWSGAGVLLVVLVVANGLTPYLQLKTGWGWNMYANLLVVDEETNHLLVPAIDLRGDHDDLLAVVSANDPAVDAYADRGAMLPRVQLEDWVVRTPGASVVARTTDGDTVTLEHGVVERSRPAWVTRVAPLRPVTAACLQYYGPAG